MKKTLEVRLSTAGGDSLSYTEFLGLLLEDEMTNRADNRRKQLYRKAHLPFEKGIEDFDFAFQPSVKKRELLELSTGNFLQSAQEAYDGRCNRCGNHQKDRHSDAI